MRCLALLALLSATACAGPVRPAASSTLSAVPDAPEEKAEHLENRTQRPTAESRQSLSETERKVETAAATAAAIIGIIFSESPNVVVGAEAPFDENKIIDVKSARTKKDAPPAQPEEPVFGPTLEK